MDKFRRSLGIVSILSVILALPLMGGDQPEPLTNDSVLQMLRWNLRPPEIVAVIERNSENSKLTLTPESIQTLSRARATQIVLDAIYKAMTKAAQHAPAVSAAPQTPVPAAPQVTPTARTPTVPPQTAQQQSQPGPASPPPPPPVVSPIPGAPPPPGTGASPMPPSQAGQPPSPSAPDNERFRKARTPIVLAQGKHLQEPKSSTKVYQLNWNDSTASPDTVYESGDSILRLINPNTILYTYQFQVKEIKGSGDDLSQWADLIKKTTGILPDVSNNLAPAGGCQLDASFAPSQSETHGDRQQDPANAPG